ncbi:hypothetical protein KIH75_01665 [Bifidobacterium sp. 64T4]|uniref:hypothetical protein n=1 Tax=Bifidobacterium pongonis TaxID=2834432 RepID=UPI001C599628|nr:hypothetical protein [Bifidobacterium pongonis]MBW3094073.1 hypothetical protein [Bifidobacterium pongonis]
MIIPFPIRTFGSSVVSLNWTLGLTGQTALAAEKSSFGVSPLDGCRVSQLFEAHCSSIAEWSTVDERLVMW